ncbi:MAG TPA: alpha/beta hydrolase [Homoserinimonas sp.]|nr:alpha/beta hydrolase [Homoserinimonas sp.]
MNLESPFAGQLSTLPIEKHEVEVLGSTTRYWVYGAPDAATTVVISHGYRGEHHGLEPVIAQLPGVRFIGPDLPGFGESTPMTESPHTIDGYATWLVAFVEALGLTGEAVILGHSFGTITSTAALAKGLPTPALILINPISVSGLNGPRPLATRATVWYYRMAGKLPERLGLALLRSWWIVQFMSMSLVKTKDKALRKWIHREHHTYFSNFASRDVVVEAFDASTSFHVGDFAAAISVPTLLVAAELDDITPVAAHTPVVNAIGDATLVVLPDVGHLIHYEKPEEAARAVEEFLARISKD